MHVLMVADRGFARFERGMIARLVVGLVDDGIDVSVAWPEGEETPDMIAAAAWIVPVPMRLPMPTDLIRKQLVRRRLESVGVASADVVHAFGGGAWGVALDLARRQDAVLAVELWRSGLTSRLRAIADAHRSRPAAQAGQGPARSTLAFAPDAQLEREAYDADAPMTVRVAPWGVHGAGGPLEGRAGACDGSLRTVAMVGNGRDAGGAAAVFEAMLKLAVDRGDVMLIADAGVVRRLRLWKRVVAAGAERFVTLHPGIEHARDAVLRSDIIVHPEACGERRSILLDAMAFGSAVVAAADKRVPWLVDGQTVRTVEQTGGAGWYTAVSRVLDDEAGTAAMAASARSFVKDRHRVSSYIAAVIDGYEWASTGPPSRLIADHAGLAAAGGEG